jgi:hypothetical protein
LRSSGKPMHPRILEGNRNALPSKRGQAYNLNLAGSDILAPDVVSGRHISPKCYTRPLCAHHICGSFYSSLPWGHLRLRLQFKLKCPPSPFLSLQKSPSLCLTRIRRTLELSTNTTLKRPCRGGRADHGLSRECRGDGGASHACPDGVCASGGTVPFDRGAREASLPCRLHRGSPRVRSCASSKIYL